MKFQKRILFHTTEHKYVTRTSRRCRVLILQLIEYNLDLLYLNETNLEDIQCLIIFFLRKCNK